jgi:hypothetical protein
VPVNSQIGVQDGAASFETGFVPDNFTPTAGGGVPPFGQDFNGALFAQTQWDQWYQAGAPIPYHGPFSTAVGGYPQGAVVDSSVVLTRQWQSFVDGNTTDPDDPLTSAGWLPVGIPPGTPVPMFTSGIVAGFLPANGLTIGNVASNGTLRANPDCVFLYAANWFNFSATACPIYTSAGVLTTRGANPYADFAANKALAMPDMKGRGVIGVDTMGGAATARLNGVPFSIGNATTPGSFCGENMHALTLPETVSHVHGAPISDPTHTHPDMQFGVRGFSTSGSAQAYQNPPGIDGTINRSIGAASTGVRVNGASLDTTSAAGGNGAHNTVEQNVTCFWNLRI